MSSQQTRHPATSILAGDVNTIELTPADYSGVTIEGQADATSQSRWGQICTPEDGLALERVGIFECDAHTIVVPVTTDEFLYVLEGELSIEQEGGSVIDLAAGGMAVLPKNRRYTLNYKTHCRQLFATCA